MTYAFLIDYEWCTGCHSCEVACQMENELPPDEFGIKLFSVGPWQYEEEKWQFDNVVVFTDQCNHCETRLEAGKLPSCVHHCQAKCLRYGTLEELLKDFEAKPKQILQII